MKVDVMEPLYALSWDLYQKAMDEAAIKVAVDAGANDGGYTYTLVENGFEVHAFEPVPSEFAKCLEKHRDNPKVRCNNLGLSDKDEVIKNVTVMAAWTIGRPEDCALNVSPGFRDAPRFDMHTVTLDDYLGDIDIGLIKLDVDGYEPQVLAGAAKTIARCKPPILCEFSCYINMGRDPGEFVNNIFAMGYSIWSMDGKVERTTWEQVEPNWPYHSSFDVMLLPR